MQALGARGVAGVGEEDEGNLEGAGQDRDGLGDERHLVVEIRRNQVVRPAPGLVALQSAHLDRGTLSRCGMAVDQPLVPCCEVSADDADGMPAGIAFGKSLSLLDGVRRFKIDSSQLVLYLQGSSYMVFEH